jgi:hypothetical protein
MPLEMQVRLAVKPTAREAWEVIHNVRVSVDCVKEANIDRLRQEFSDIMFKPGEMVEDFALCLSTLASELCVLGDVISDKEVIKRMPHVIPEKLEHVAIFMETLLDLNSLSIEEAISHLRTVK